MANNYEFDDRFGNTWNVGIGLPTTHAMHEGQTTYGWIVSITSSDGAKVQHQHQNLAEAVSEAVAKADWLRN
jgi:hypothetical protein